jgi:hypothetical protein
MGLDDARRGPGPRYHFTWDGWDDPNCAQEGRLAAPDPLHFSAPSPITHIVRVSEVIPTAAVERPLSEVGVPGAKESPH